METDYRRHQRRRLDAGIAWMVALVLPIGLLYTNGRSVVKYGGGAARSE